MGGIEKTHAEGILIVPSTLLRHGSLPKGPTSSATAIQARGTGCAGVHMSTLRQEDPGF